jgi:glycine hydroxymethyltransferase
MTDPHLERRGWVAPHADDVTQRIAATVDTNTTDAIDAIASRIGDLAERSRAIHERDCLNLNPATSVMNPRAEALLSSRLGSRPSLGHPGNKYEMGLEAIEEIEVITAELAARVFRAPFVEVRVPSGAIANLITFMACAAPGDPIIAPPASIAGHVTHQSPGAAGLYGLEIHEAPVDADHYTVDIDRLAEIARRVRPRLITVGGSLNLDHHPVAAIREVADRVGAIVLFDAAHLSGLIAGDAWPNPLDEGAHVMTMSTYKSLAGPPAGLVVTNDPNIAARVDAVAFPGLTANFDVAKTAALAVTLLDWLACGAEHAEAMVASAAALAGQAIERGVSVHLGGTRSHAFAVESDDGHSLALQLRAANLLSSAIGLPGDSPERATGLRVGTNELVRWGMATADMATVASLLARAIAGEDPATVAAEVTALRATFDTVHFVR